LEKYSTRTSSGVGWGYPYTWHTQYHTFTPGEPVITVTPYVFFAYAKMYSITKENDCLRMLNDILDFVRYDIIDTDIDPDTKASSYGPNDSSMVINAVAYRAATLCEAYKIFPESDIIELAQKNINFVLSSQNKDGSWLYANDSRFIDNFHTSFVMNKLLKCYCVIGDEKILDSIKRGYNFYLNNFFRSNGTQIHFYKTRFPKFRYIETYDYAEAITLGVQLKDYVNESFQVAQNLARFLVSNLQTPDGYFVTRVSILRTKNKIPYLRWPQAQLFYSLTNLLQELD